MFAYTLRRLGLALVTLWLATLLVFGALLLIPGNPAQAILGIEATPPTSRPSGPAGPG